MKYSNRVIIFVAVTASLGACVGEGDSPATPAAEPSAQTAVVGAEERILEPVAMRIDAMQMLEDGNYSLTVAMGNSQPVNGFQFQVQGVTIVAADGGSASQQGFFVGTNPSGMVLGFHYEGVDIPVGDTALTYLTVTPTTAASEICLTDLILADGQGEAIEIDTTSRACVSLP